MGSMAERVLEGLKRVDLDRKTASLRAQLSETYARDLIEGKSKNPRMDHLRRFAAVIDTTAEELMFGPGSPQAKAAKLLGMFERLSDTQKDVLLQLAGALLGGAHTVNEASAPSDGVGRRTGTVE